MKPKVIVFGIGDTFKSFIKNYNKDDFDIIGLSDWDERNHGRFIEGYEVLDPYKLDKSSFDYILIASYYVREIKQQLKERINLEGDKVQVPPKSIVKHGHPFENSPQTVKFAMDFITEITKMAERKGIDLFLDFGTLLGLVRDGHIIEWDDDIDLSMNEKDSNAFRELLIENKDNLPYSDKLNWTARHLIDKEGNSWNFNFLFFNNETPGINEFDIGIGVNKVFNGQSVCMRGRYLARPAKHFEEYDELIFEGVSLKAPKDYIGYLDYVYGDWGKPKVYKFGQQYGFSQKGEKTHYPELNPGCSIVRLF